MSDSGSEGGKSPARARQRIDDIDAALNRLRELNAAKLCKRAKVLPSLVGRSSSYIEQLVEEYLKFLLLKGIEKDSSAKHLSPSGEVDAIWHVHLLDTMAYKKSCEMVGLSFIHHNPDGADCERQPSRLAASKKLYKQTFGYKPHPEFWLLPIVKREENTVSAKEGSSSKIVIKAEDGASTIYPSHNYKMAGESVGFVGQLFLGLAGGLFLDFLLMYLMWGYPNSG